MDKLRILNTAALCEFLEDHQSVGSAEQKTVNERRDLSVESRTHLRRNSTVKSLSGPSPVTHQAYLRLLFFVAVVGTNILLVVCTLRDRPELLTVSVNSTANNQPPCHKNAWNAFPMQCAPKVPCLMCCFSLR